MPSPSRFWRLARLATLPETRGLLVAAAQSTTLRTIARRAVDDRAGLRRDLTDPARLGGLVRGAVRNPAVVELANAGLLVLPIRYLPLGWVATWATRRALRRYLDRVEAVGPTTTAAVSAAAAGSPSSRRTAAARPSP